MQKIFYIFLFSSLYASVSAQKYKGHTLTNDLLSIDLSEGILRIIPLTEKAVRVQYQIGNAKEAQEFVLINTPKTPAFVLKETENTLKVSTKATVVTFYKKTGILDYSDPSGKVFLREKANTRRLKPASIMGESCFEAEQGFESPNDEYLFGLGQFQDGFYNLKM